MFDDFTTPDDIACLFAKTYQELYTSVDFDKVEMRAVRNDIDVAVASVGFNGDCVISCKDVEQAINRLNPGKSDGNGELKTNHVISAGNYLAVYIYIYNIYIYHYFYLDFLHMVQLRKSLYYVYGYFDT